MIEDVHLLNNLEQSLHIWKFKDQVFFKDTFMNISTPVESSKGFRKFQGLRKLQRFQDTKNNFLMRFSMFQKDIVRTLAH